MEKTVYHLKNKKKNSLPEEELIKSLLLDKVKVSTEIINRTNVDFYRFFEFASKHKILPYLCNKIATLNLIDELPKQYAEKIKRIIITATVVHTHFKEKLFNFSKIL